MSPFRSRYVTVALAVIGELPAVVEAEDDTEIELSLSVQAPPGLDRALDRPVRIECFSPRGIQHVTGIASWDAALPDRLRIRRLDDTVIQRRETVRVQAVIAATLSLADAPAAGTETTTLNLSGTGLLLRDPLELPIGTHVRVHLGIDDGGAPLAVTGRVVREAGGDQKGICIEEISAADQIRLTRFITERQRAELRIARGG
jgi:hypothetical protein